MELWMLAPALLVSLAGTGWSIWAYTKTKKRVWIAAAVFLGLCAAAVCFLAVCTLMLVHAAD